MRYKYLDHTWWSEVYENKCIIIPKMFSFAVLFHMNPINLFQHFSIMGHPHEWAITKL